MENKKAQEKGKHKIEQKYRFTMVNLFTSENERIKWRRKSKNERRGKKWIRKFGDVELNLWKRVQLFSYSNFSHSLQFLSRCKTCQIKYPKAENKPPKKTQFIILSTTNLPCQKKNAPDHQQFPTANLPPPWPYYSTGTVLPRLQTDSWCLRKYKWISIILLRTNP